MKGINSARSVEELLAVPPSDERIKYLLFWGHTPPQDGSISKSCFSQWYEAPFQIGTHRYPTAEHYMMAAKARLFDDRENEALVMQAAHPKQAKELGRRVRGFDEETWTKERFRLVVEGNHAKFSQTPALLEFLLGTGDRVLVEASPYDRIWGIGLAAGDPGAENPSAWNGLNLLGFALMEVREQLRQT